MFLLCFICGICYSQSRIGQKREKILNDVEYSIDTVLNGTHRVIYKSNEHYTHFYFLDSCNVCKFSMIICVDDFGRNLLMKSFDITMKRDADAINVWYDEMEDVYVYLLFHDEYKKYFFWFEKENKQ